MKRISHIAFVFIILTYSYTSFSINDDSSRAGINKYAAASLSASSTADLTKIRVMPLGNSITDGYNIPGGYRLRLWENLEASGLSCGVNLVGTLDNNSADGLGDDDHEGHNGWRIDEIYDNIVSWMDDTHPDIVMMEIGTNDFVQDYDVSNAPSRLSMLIDRICSKLPAGGKLYVASLTPYMGRGYDPIDDFNAEVPQMVFEKQNAGKPVFFVDAYNALTDDDMSDDLIHPNQSGCNKLGDLWFNTIKNDILSACEGYRLITDYTGEGYVDRSPDKEFYDEGDEVTLTAIPENGYEFTGWSGDVSEISNPLVVSMTSPKHITANFEAPIYKTLDINASHGTVAVNPDLDFYSIGDHVVLTAVPEDGYQFSGWDGSISGYANPVDITVNGNMVITAYFIPADDIIVYSDEHSMIGAITGSVGTLTELNDIKAYEGQKHLLFDYSLSEGEADMELNFDAVDLSALKNLSIATKGPNISDHFCRVSLMDKWKHSGPVVNLERNEYYTLSRIPVSSLADDQTDLNNITGISIMLDGDETGPGKLALDDISFTVENEPVKAVTDMVLDRRTSIIRAGSTLQLNAIITPSDATNRKVIWQSSDKTVATIDMNGLLTAVSPGAALILATTVDGGKSAKCIINVREYTDIADIYNTGLFIYPNPVSSLEPGFSITGLEDGHAELLIIDMSGRMIQQDKININDSRIDIQPHNISQGLYAVRLINNSCIYTLKLIVR